MALTPEQWNTVNGITNESIQEIVIYLAERECEVIAPNALYRMGGTTFTYRYLQAYVHSHFTTTPGKPLMGVDLAIARYEHIVGVTPLTLPMRRAMAKWVPNSERALEMAMEMASWAWAGAPAGRLGEEHDMREELAHGILRWVENAKRRILGLDPEYRQVVLNLWGVSGTYKSSVARKLIAPLRDLQKDNASLEALLTGHDGAWAAVNVALLIDDMGPVPKALLGHLKAFVYAPEWRSNPKGKDSGMLPMLASLITTSNHAPGAVFPDEAMTRRLVSAHFKYPIPPQRQKTWAKERLEPFDAYEFWKVVDPVETISDAAIIQRNQSRYSFKDPLDLFIEDNLQSVPNKRSYVLLSDFYNMFRTRAVAGGWDIRGISDRVAAERLRGHGFDTPRSSKGTRIMGVVLSEDPVLSVVPPDEAEEEFA